MPDPSHPAGPPSPQHRLLEIEHGTLREEARGLKTCQVTFVSLAVTGTGAVLGLAARADGLERVIAYLAPICIQLPTWLIFFDKATSINRIVAYLRHIEAGFLGNQSFGYYPGWENALEEYRKLQSDHQKTKKVLGKTKTKITPYHWIVFVTYLLLVATCILLAVQELPRVKPSEQFAAVVLLAPPVVASVIVLFLVVAYLFGLSSGKYSVRAAYKLWHYILQPTEAKNEATDVG